MKKEDFYNTKWDAQEWTEVMKRNWQEKMFSLGFAWYRGHTITGLDAEFYYLREDLVITQGECLQTYSEHHNEPKLYEDAFPKVTATGDNMKSNPSGGSCNYYMVSVEKPTTASAPYQAECNDIIESLQLTFAESNIYKEIWRTANGRANNNGKPNNDPVRAAEKVLFFALRNAIQSGVDVNKLIDGVNINETNS